MVESNNLVKCFSNSVLGVNLTTILIDMEPWFIAKEVATILGYTKTEKAVNKNVKPKNQRMLSNAECKNIFGDMMAISNEDDDSETLENTEESRVPLEGHSNFNSRGMKIINEAGLYSLALRSRKPEAETFQDWVVEDVLPSIRKTGSYNIQKQVPQTYLEALKALVASEEEKEQLKLANEVLTTERDHAIKTKQQISDSKTAKALGRVGGLVTANNRLKDELYLNRNYRTISAVAQLNGISENALNWRLLKSYCEGHDLKVMKIQGVRFQINIYPIEAFRALYPELRVD